MEKFGSGINIPDPLHCCTVLILGSCRFCKLFEEKIIPYLTKFLGHINRKSAEYTEVALSQSP